MILADVLKIVFLVLGALLVVVSYWLAATALAPHTVSRARAAYATRPARIAITGSLAGIPLILVGAALVQAAPHPFLKLFGAGLAALPVFLGLIGSAGLSEHVGYGLVHQDDVRTPWRRSMRGAVILSFTFLLPFIGWFVVLPLVLLSGFGAMITTAKRRRSIEPAVLINAA